MSETTCYTTIDTRFGPVLVAGGDRGVTRVNFLRGPHPVTPGPDWREDGRPLADAVEQLRAYFAGKLRHFELPLDPRGTPFQLEVWRALREIGYGETISYGELAARIGKPTASRAVGAANGRNPIPVIVPCHRVIGADGSLTGYGEGLPVKAALLALERGRANGERADQLSLL